MPRRRADLNVPVTVTAFSSVNLSAAWQAFCSQHQAWLAQVGTTAPLYRLPAEAISRLATARQKYRAVIDPSSAQAERALAGLCQSSHAVGFWNGQPIEYSCLTPPAPLLNADECKTFGWSNSDWLHYKQGREITVSGRPRLKGYAGWLLTEPVYLEQAQRLAVQWEALLEEQRPAFALRRAVARAAEPPGAVPAADATSKFAEALREFLDRWGLVGMATWDLPEPQGPLLPHNLPPGSPALPTHGLHLFLPLHYPLQDDDALHRQVAEQQKLLTQQLGIDLSMAGLPHYKAYAQILEVIHLQQTVESRYGKGLRPKNFVGQIEEAIADTLGCGTDLVKKLRKAIAACRKGRRSAVKWLRPRVR